ncbi:hypothetical protein MCOR27_009540 [Pyricularia oryzae]|uniref:Zn(2)-C6 fungal-type domain-containing protein n=3 Tax=Pyricularia TaxID=48558 RepID=A0ABQ8NLG8_PYRGI|nr:C6 zinc finger protein [Pyricularia oryzae 70-15]KAH8841710.1 hypothetical protein MCOR01_005666 [Pyricularia oryzae]KAI6298845.1 hypothetical protein MCOR33_005129 [Pyricularia grisea]EHA57568.1 C6 zinc finger protein [Pyricularia oryzae 70-15]KAH9434877.1 hypothetical protein MCOR02_003842 [Pyricularia oryzae]KAI6255167.1 hypothetical protein MCOR19_008334 [Pyricularia oryzae]
MTTAVKRACDACHRRKVKCDGINPCRNCSSAQLSCTYNAIPQKKGPKGSRAKVISELRETQRQTSLATKVHNRLNGAPSPPASPAPAPSRGLLTKEMVSACIEFYFANMFSIIPILNRQQVEHDLGVWETDPETYSLMTSLCAFMMLQPGMSMPGGDPYGLDAQPGASIVSARLLMEETSRVRRLYDHLEKPSLNSVCTSYFLFACHYGLEEHDRAWYHLRDALTVTLMFGMNKEESYLTVDNATASRWRRLYWLLYMTERSYAIQRGRPLSLQATVNLPTLGDGPMDPFGTQLSSFLLLITIFRQFDDQFTNLWCKSRNNCSSSYINTLHKNFNEVLPHYLNNVDPQLADARNNQAWLKNLIWQLSMAKTQNVSDTTVQYPVDLQRELVAMTGAFSTQNTELINAGFIEKLCETSSSLIDVLTVQPATQNPFSPFNPRETLQQIFNLVGVIRKDESRFLPLLLCKMHEVIPRLISPMLQHMPDNMCSVDIFDGFGNAGMGQPSTMQMDDFDYRFPEPSIKTEPGTSSGASVPSVTDMHSPFSSSPPVISPQVEYPQGITQDFNPISDMMSPVGPGQQLNGPGGMGSHQTQHRMPQPPPQQHHQYTPTSAHNHPPKPTIQTMGHNMSTHHQNSLHGGINQPSNIPGQHPLPQQPLTSAAVRGPQPFSPAGAMNHSIMPGGPAMLMRPQPPQRSNSFAMPPPSNNTQLRTVGDFQTLQRTNSDMSVLTNSMGVSMGGGGGGMMGTEIDFNTLSR